MSDGDSGRRVVDGRFELRVRLGGGGLGIAWRAHDLLPDRDVAVKEVRLAEPDLAEYDRDSARMLRERVLREAGSQGGVGEAVGEGAAVDGYAIGCLVADSQGRVTKVVPAGG